MPIFFLLIFLLCSSLTKPKLLHPLSGEVAEAQGELNTEKGLEPLVEVCTDWIRVGGGLVNGKQAVA